MKTADPFRFADVIVRSQPDAIERAIYARARLGRDRIVLTAYQQQMLEDLREGWRESQRVALTLSDGGTVKGKLTHVAVTGAFVLVSGIHVPVDRIEDYEIYG